LPLLLNCEKLRWLPDSDASLLLAAFDGLEKADAKLLFDIDQCKWEKCIRAFPKIVITVYH